MADRVLTKKDIFRKLTVIANKWPYITGIIKYIGESRGLINSIGLYFGPVDRSSYKSISSTINKALHSGHISHKHHKWTKIEIKNSLVDTYKKIGPFTTKDINKSKFRQKFGLPCANIIHQIYGSYEKAIKSNKLPLKKFLIGENPISKFTSYNKGRNEDKILNNIETKLGYKLKRQLRIGKYYVDGYDEKNNIAYEIDEIYHHNIDQKQKDKNRELYIKQLLKCSFIRIDENKYLDILEA